MKNRITVQAAIIAALVTSIPHPAMADRAQTICVTTYGVQSCPCRKCAPSSPPAAEPIINDRPKLQIAQYSSRPVRDERPLSIGIEANVLANRNGAIPIPWAHLSYNISPRVALDLKGSGVTDGQAALVLAAAGGRLYLRDSWLSPYARFHGGVLAYFHSRFGNSTNLIFAGAIGLEMTSRDGWYLNAEVGPSYIGIPDDDAGWFGSTALGFGYRF